MAKYIKAVEAAEKVAEATGINIADLVDIFAEIPAADVAPVVHCKDCKYSCIDGNGRTCEGCWYELSEYAVPVKDDDFCSYAERKEATSNATDRC